VNPIRLVFLVLAMGTALGAPAAAVACETYVIDDSFGLEDGVQWAFAGHVESSIPNPEIQNRPQAVILAVDRTLVGSADLRELRVNQDDGCDGFWYGPGDELVAALGNVPGLTPPFENATNYVVAVWVIRDGAILGGDRRVPLIRGQRPESEADLLRLIGAVPETDTAELPRSPSKPGGLPNDLLVVAAVGAAIGLRRFRSVITTVRGD
jgi:hypothetical protein